MAIQTVSPGITRIEIGNRKGYLVRISRGGNRINQYYSDSVNGGKAKALKAAKMAYEELVATHGPVKNSTKNVMTQRNTTGVVGVHLAHSKDNRYEGCEYSAYCASWVSESGKRQKISFAFNKYGDKAAFDLAVMAREAEQTDRDTVVAKYARTAKGKRNLKAAGFLDSKASATKSSNKRAKTAKKSVKKSASKTQKNAAKKATRKAVKKSAKKTVKKSTRKPAKKAARKPAKKVAKKSARKKATRRR